MRKRRPQSSSSRNSEPSAPVGPATASPVPSATVCRSTGGGGVSSGEGEERGGRRGGPSHRVTGTLGDGVQVDRRAGDLDGRGDEARLQLPGASPLADHQV